MDNINKRKCQIGSGRRRSSALANVGRQVVSSNSNPTSTSLDAIRELSAMGYPASMFPDISPREQLSLRKACEGQQYLASDSLRIRQERIERERREQQNRIREQQSGKGKRRKKKGKKKKKKDPIKEVYKKFPFLLGIKKEMKKGT